MKIPATVITGFLGAGKTSMVRHLLQNAGGRRIALIINEFGDLGVDRQLIDGCAIEGCAAGDIIELANGCICCTVADDFLPTMEALIGRDNPPDHIVIETSGLALPKPLIKAFNWPEIRSRVTVDGVIAVIDAAAVADGRFALNEAAAADRPADHDNPLEEVFADQIMSADLIVLNKSDLIDARALDAVRAVIAADMRPAVRIVPAVGGAVGVEVVLGLAAAAEDDLASRPSHHDGDDGEHDHDDFESFAMELADIHAPDALDELLGAVVRSHDILRIKGFAHVPGLDMRHVIQGVGPRIQRYFDRPWGDGEARRGHLVVIGLRGLDRGAIASAIAAGIAG